MQRLESSFRPPSLSNDDFSSHEQLLPPFDISQLAESADRRITNRWRVRPALMVVIAVAVAALLRLAYI